MAATWSILSVILRGDECRRVDNHSHLENVRFLSYSLMSRCSVRCARISPAASSGSYSIISAGIAMVAETAVVSARERVLQAAERVVSLVGAARLTLNAVANAAGVSKGGLLYHFPSKEALLTALAQRYVDSMKDCISTANDTLSALVHGRELKACILGVLGDDPRSKAMGAALLAAAANDLTLLEVIRQRIADYTDEIAASNADFARAAIVTLAVDGLKFREWLRISSFSDEQREQIVDALLRIAEEAYK